MFFAYEYYKSTFLRNSYLNSYTAEKIATLRPSNLETYIFHFEDTESAINNNKKNNKTKRGASTISQQTAKNVFLWPSRSWLRKGLEAYFTVLIELFWDKQRIIEVYLNSIEMGNGIFGIAAVADKHFDKEPEKLTKRQCALIAATLPNPIKFNSAAPSPYMRKRQRVILREMNSVKIDDEWFQ